MINLEEEPLTGRVNPLQKSRKALNMMREPLRKGSKVIILEGEPLKVSEK
ncbi:hypothetical protein VYF65_002629 [Lysinibacillus irui]